MASRMAFTEDLLSIPAYSARGFRSVRRRMTSLKLSAGPFRAFKRSYASFVIEMVLVAMYVYTCMHTSSTFRRVAKPVLDGRAGRVVGHETERWRIRTPHGKCARRRPPSDLALGAEALRRDDA